MAYVKVTKTSSYFSRYQVKYRRRREGKTDYRARLRLVKQDKNKYNTPKYRLVVRFTNKDIIAQVTYATIGGDKIVGAAYAHELPKYGLKAGLTNYAAGYAVGLLVARRVLTKFNLAETYTGAEEINGEDFTVEPVADGPRPFTALLDTGLKRTSTGSKVFSVLKGALDGGLNVPHSEKRFIGYDRFKKEFNAEELRDYIFGEHVADWMNDMKEEEPELFKAHFSRYIKAGLKADDLEETLESVHEAIRENPVHEKKARKAPAAKKLWLQPKKTLEARRADLKEKLAQLL